MKIEMENKRIIKKFGNLKRGEIFIDDDTVYIKMNDFLENNNAFEFECGGECYFYFDKEVEIPQEVILKVKV